MIRIDLNMDLGEGMAVEAAVMPYISSSNIACGGHYGTAKSMSDTVALAIQHQVNIGAHPSYEDVENFGRVKQDWDELRFRESVINQITALNNIVIAQSSHLSHIKMHGALYHATGYEPDYITWTIQLIKDYYKHLSLYVPAGSPLEAAMKTAGLRYHSEAFSDRNYQANGKLVPRSQPNAVITNVSQAVNHIEQMVKQRQVKTITGEVNSLKASTYCMHGDNTALVSEFPAFVEALAAKGIQIEKSV